MAMLVMKRPRFSTRIIGSSPSFHSAMETRPQRTPVSTPTYGSGSVSANEPRHVLPLGFPGAQSVM